jgi:formate hydrogenlyase subunit 3/multisubunit Na+/H+ antiporter MnhD subunit
MDGLTAFFVATLGVVAAPALLFATRYLEPGRSAPAIR